MPAGNTYEAIATNTLVATASSIDFTSISSAYTDLVLVMYLQDSGGGATVRINNDSGSNYSRTLLYGSGNSTVTGFRDSGTTIPTGGQASPNFSPEIMHFMNYSNTTTFKTVLTRQNEALASFIAIGASLYRSTSAINRITINATSTNSLQIGTQVSLYGIKAA